jgi:Phosphopantetheine attachment site
MPTGVREVVANALAQVKRDATLPARLHDTTDLRTEVGLDSIELTELMLQLEDAAAHSRARPPRSAREARSPLPEARSRRPDGVSRRSVIGGRG